LKREEIDVRQTPESEQASNAAACTAHAREPGWARLVRGRFVLIDQRQPNNHQLHGGTPRAARCVVSWPVGVGHARSRSIKYVHTSRALQSCMPGCCSRSISSINIHGCEYIICESMHDAWAIYAPCEQAAPAQLNSHHLHWPLAYKPPIEGDWKNSRVDVELQYVTSSGWKCHR
jgi:hypothetical protein